tara:strand:- start:1191 stop:1793 length:603 start_codon:yes stop_codon:yes gene_type:complete
MARFQELPTEDNALAQRQFDGPIPGQSLTDEPGRWAWEEPPEITNPDDAVVYVIDKFEGSKKTQSAYSKLMLAGMPIESIVNTISFAGFMEGKWTVDVAEIIKPPLMSFFVAYADEHEIPYKVFNNPEELTNDGIPDNQVLSLMADRNPEAFSELEQAVAMQQQDQQNMNAGFLNPQISQEQMIAEDMPVEQPIEPMEEI